MLRDKEFLKEIRPCTIVGGAVEVKFKNASSIIREAINLRNYTLPAARLDCPRQSLHVSLWVNVVSDKWPPLYFHSEVSSCGVSQAIVRY